MQTNEIIDCLQQALDALQHDKQDISVAVDLIACVINPLVNPGHEEVRECAAILAGLRLLQRTIQNNNLPADIDDIATNCGAVVALDTDEIDCLCDRINA
jgi:hypothetical protein